MVQLTGIDFNKHTFKMVGGLSIDDLKIKYNWFLNAEVEDAVIGEDKNGLVWYQGKWIGGVWENGTWYSGEFQSGRWKKGNWFSYDIDQNQMLKGKLHINRIDISKSKFISGDWEDGTFNYGIFGTINNTELPYEITLDYILNNIDDFLLSGETYIIDGKPAILPVFKKGEFINGIINGAKIEGGNIRFGFINNTIWENGNFYNGYFLGDIWYNGNFYGGDFSNGIWKDGNLISSQDNIITRFGINYKNENSIIWENGRFINGEFHSTLNTQNGKPIPSSDHSISNWENGTWENGTWYGGTWENGTWISGTFLDGVVENINWVNGYFHNGLWINGEMSEGLISGGIFKNIITNNVNFGYDI